MSIAGACVVLILAVLLLSDQCSSPLCWFTARFLRRGKQIKRLSLLVRLRFDSGVLAGECLARNVGVPVHERAVGILLPRPDMQRVERREPEAIRTVEQMEKLSHELRRIIRMFRIPRVGENQKVSAEQSQTPI